MPIEEAKKLGAMALFGEKYGDIVRVVTAGDFSREFCGGTDVKSASELGLFKVVSESSAAAGIRRIEAVTGMGFLTLLNDNLALINKTAAAMKVANVHDLPNKALQLENELKEKQKELDALNAKIAASNIQGLFDKATEIEGVKLITAKFDGADSQALRTMCDKVKDLANDKAYVCVFAGIADGKGTLAAAATKAAIAKNLKAGVIVKAAAMVAGGNGGGKPDFAMAGIKDLAKVEAALNTVAEIIAKEVK